MIIYTIVIITLTAFFTAVATTKVIHQKIAIGELFLINGIVYKGAVLLKNPATRTIAPAETAVLTPEEPPYKGN